MTTTTEARRKLKIVQDGEAPSTPRAAPLLTLSDLRALSADELERAYAAAATPALGALDGPYDGALLDVWMPPNGKRLSVERLSGPWLPWRGKRFTRESLRGGNRFRIVGGERTIWPFATRIAPSQFGGGDALWIDYDLPTNPTWLRQGVFDELKELRDGLYLGVGGVRLGGKPRLLFHWAIVRA